ncbi:MAG TPA: hypothetical protein VKB31_00050 [Trueperaceae bacterium]|nr:hypothetical protein [Trueperaceae bacterium]
MELPYRPRRIRFVRLEEAKGWRLKVYNILHHSKEASEALLAAATDTALAFLPQPAVTPERYGVGFLTVHQGSSYDFLTVAYWNYQTELKSQTYMRPSSGSYLLEPLSGSELSADVWDLRLLAFERDAWVETVLRPERADLEAYLQRTLEEEA